MAGVFVAMLGGDPDHRLGGPVLYFAGLSVCGGLLVLSILLLLVRRRGAD
ncbi:hypothetical protein Afe04nite_24720 [Asanoa ferruginea]|nr:hypothetical protein Afe04nite_24720 [Asanoa ferruginea]